MSDSRDPNRTVKIVEGGQEVDITLEEFAKRMFSGKVTYNFTGPFNARVKGTLPWDTGDIDPILNKLEDDGETH
jgi:hypothetical protein